jgi:hypothetical protein
LRSASCAERESFVPTFIRLAGKLSAAPGVFKPVPGWIVGPAVAIQDIFLFGFLESISGMPLQVLCPRFVAAILAHAPLQRLLSSFLGHHKLKGKSAKRITQKPTRSISSDSAKNIIATGWSGHRRENKSPNTIQP